MRDFKGMKRQRGRNRGGGNNGGGKPQQNANRAFESNGPENLKVRGHAQHVFEKYQQLARDTMSSGDRVLAENFLQHAEHYFRLLRTLQPNRPPADILGRENFSAGYDIDFEEEPQADAGDDMQNADGGEAGQGEEGGQPRADQTSRADQSSREGRWDNRDGQRGDNRQDRGDRQGYRQNNNGQGGRDYNQNGGQNGQGNAQRGYRAERDRYEGRDGGRDYRDQNGREPYSRDQNSRDQNSRDQYRDRGGRDQGREGAEDRNERQSYGRSQEPLEQADPMATVQPDAAPLTTSADDRSAPASASPLLRSEDGGVSHAPAFLQSTSAPAPVAAEETPAKRPRGRPRRKIESAETEEV